jgi:hypothetical protein
MGRPSLRKKGAFTAAERQRRRRKKLKSQKSAAEEAERITRTEAERRVAAASLVPDERRLFLTLGPLNRRRR